MEPTPIGVRVMRGDTSRHLSFAVLEAGLRALPSPPVDGGRVTHIVRRPAGDTREMLQRAWISPEKGLPGDAWIASPKPEAQLAVMRRDVAELIANGQSVALFGDNLLVDFDLSVANLPVGSRVSVGGAVVEVTPMPHNGCRKFGERFGGDALRFVNEKPTRHLNLRGIYWLVVEAGEVAVGSPVRILSRPALTR